MGIGYLVPGDSFFPLSQGKQCCQTFRPDEDITLHWIDLNLKLWGFYPVPSVQVFHADGDHHPFGDVLSRDKLIRLPHRYPGNTVRVRFPMQAITLDKDSYYAIVVQSMPALGEIEPEWAFDADDATYPRGIRLWRNSIGDPWTPEVNDDHIFFVFGDPPAPPPPPEPPVPNWAILDIQQHLTLTGYQIILITSVPCHLFMYYTLHEPDKHKEPILRRGLRVSEALRYCFVDWEQNEQEEDGDTLVHTFIKEPWPVCETRWFTFRGQINEEWSPSAAPIFKKHRVGITREYHAQPLSVFSNMASGQFMAQSFTPQDTYLLLGLAVKLKLSQPVTSGTYTVQIRTNNVDEPSETILWQDTFSIFDLKVDQWKWLFFELPSIPSIMNVPLWIVCTGNWIPAWVPYPFWATDDDNPYPRGERLVRLSLAHPWIGKGHNYDAGFITWST